MKKTQLLLAILLFSLVNNLTAQEKEWTLLLYVIGTDIVEDAITDLDEIKAAGNTDNINIVGLLGGAQIPGWEEPRSSIFVDGNEISQSFLPSDNIMVSTTNLTEFINWGIENYPAEKYMIAFYNHGMAMRGFGHENVSDSQFAIDDLKTGIANSNFINQGNKFELLAFDACLMANLETQSVLKDFGKYYIASQEEEPWHAWNWTPVISAMNNQSGLNGSELGQIIIDNYIQHSIDKMTTAVTLSISDLSKITALEKSIEDVFLALDDDLYLANLIRAMGQSEEYGKVINDPSLSEDVVDIGDLFNHLKDLEPGISDLIDIVLSNLDNAIEYERSDASRPGASGMSMFVPYNKFQNEGDLDFIIDDYYNLISHSSTIKNFIKDTYVPFGLGDDSPLAGGIDNSLGFTDNGGNGVLGMKYSAIKLDSIHVQDLDQLQVILLEEIIGDPNDFIVLGSTHVDTIVSSADGSRIYGYEWDEDWLSIDGKPAYIADIQDFEIKDANGNVIETFTRLHKPAILNAGTANEKDIVMSYKLDEDGNYTLEGIEREHYMVGNTVVPSKERIQLVPGDMVQMIYEIFDVTTNEAQFVPDVDNVVVIENGNNDLNLEHSVLDPGNYHVGFVLMDHAQNDTIIYDPMVRTVVISNTDDQAIEDNLEIFPNPFTNRINLKIRNQKARYILINAVGIEVFRGKRIWEYDFSSLQTGIYYLTTEQNVGQNSVVTLFKK